MKINLFDGAERSSIGLIIFSSHGPLAQPVLV